MSAPINSSRPALNLDYSSSSEILKHFVALTNKQLQQMDLNSGSSCKFNGSVLEVFLNPKELSRRQQLRKIDSNLYIKCGLFLYLLKSIIKKHGFQCTIHTWPRFDEPNLLAFVHLDAFRTAAFVHNRQKAAPDYADAGTFAEKLEAIAAKKGITLQSIKPGKQQQETALLLQQQPACCSYCKSNTFSSHWDDMIDGKTDGILLIASARQNTPAVWTGLGLMLGKAIQVGSNSGFGLIPLNLHFCPTQFSQPAKTLCPGENLHLIAFLKENSPILPAN
ncbi:MAG: hypothetical protein JJU35_01765 [Balneolales bacterium]|nr:hypothetical protein [Balneolales bacterium]